MFCVVPGRRARRKKRIVFGIGQIALLCAVMAQAQEKPDAPAADNRMFTPAPRFAKGQIFRYQTQSGLTMRFKAADAASAGASVSSVFNSTLRYTVKETRPDGSTLFSMLSEGARQIDASNSIVTQPKDPDNHPRTITLDKLGKLLAFKDPSRSTPQSSPLDGLFSQMNLLVSLHFLPMPDKPVKVGDTWTARYPLPGAKPAPEKKASGKPGDEEDRSAIRVEITLLGVEKIGEQETLKLKQALSVPSESAVNAEGKVTEANKAAGHIRILLTYTQTVNILPEDGGMARSQGLVGGWVKFEGSAAKLVPSDTLTIEGTLTAVRLPDKEPANAKPEK